MFELIISVWNNLNIPFYKLWKHQLHSFLQISTSACIKYSKTFNYLKLLHFCNSFNIFFSFKNSIYVSYFKFSIMWQVFNVARHSRSDDAAVRIHWRNIWWKFLMNFLKKKLFNDCSIIFLHFYYRLWIGFNSYDLLAMHLVSLRIGHVSCDLIHSVWNRFKK